MNFNKDNMTVCLKALWKLYDDETMNTILDSAIDEVKSRNRAPNRKIYI